MSVFDIPTEEQVATEAQSGLKSIREELGFVPNLQRLMTTSPAAFAGFQGLEKALAQSFDRKTREAVSLAVSDENSCDYCVAAHGYFGARQANLSANEIAMNRRGESEDPKRAAAAAFGKKLIQLHGKVTGEDVAAMRWNGFTDPEILELVGLTIQVMFSNYIANVGNIVNDYPAALIDAD